MTRLDDLIALAALGELTPDEERELDTLLAGEPDAGAELDDALRAAAMLQGVHDVAPPAGLRDRVLDAVAHDEHRAPLDSADVPRHGERLQAADPAPVRPTGTVVPLRRRLTPVLAVAAASVLLLVGALFVAGRSSDDSVTVADVVAAADRTERLLTGELSGLRAVYSPDAGALAIVGTGIPAVADDRTYEAWLVDGDVATSIGRFRPDTDGTVEFVADGVDPTGVVIGVTEEPAGGSAQPTLPILASA